MNKKEIIHIIAIVLVFSSLLAVSYLSHTQGLRQGKKLAPNPTPKIIIKQVPVNPKGTLISVTLTDLEDDLKLNATHLSTRQRKEVLDAITKTAELYKISPLILFSIIKVETDYRFNIDHKPTLVTVFKNGIKGKKIKKKVRAIGGTGIIYELWGHKLRKAGIIETRNDLYTPKLNILACGFIFNELRNKPLKKGVTDPNVSAMLHYFGGDFKSYSDKIEAKIGSIIFKKVYK